MLFKLSTDKTVSETSAAVQAAVVAQEVEDTLVRIMKAAAA